MIYLTDEIALTADSIQYIVGKPVQRPGKGVEMQNPKYYHKLSAALQQALPISVLAAVFFATMLLEQYALRYLRRAKGGKGVTGFYLLSKMLRLLLAIVMLLAYAFAIRTNIVLFAVNLFVCYIITVVLSSIFCVKGEQKGKTTIQ